MEMLELIRSVLVSMYNENRVINNGIKRNLIFLGKHPDIP